MSLVKMNEIAARHYRNFLRIFREKNRIEPGPRERCEAYFAAQGGRLPWWIQ